MLRFNASNIVAHIDGDIGIKYASICIKVLVGISYIITFYTIVCSHQILFIF